jgi:hypothetical protein
MKPGFLVITESWVLPLICLYFWRFLLWIKWLGLIQNRRQVITFFFCVLGGGIVGALLMKLERAGIFGVVTIRDRSWNDPLFCLCGFIWDLGLQNAVEAARSLTLVVLIAAVLAHFLEINFGSPLRSRIYFWVLRIDHSCRIHPPQVWGVYSSHLPCGKRSKIS